MKISHSDRPSKGRQVRLVIELEEGRVEGEPLYAFVISLPGRPGTLEREWGKVGRQLTADEYNDMSAYLAGTLADFIWTAGGLADRLPFAPGAS